MITGWVRALRSSRLRSAVREQAEFYGRERDPEEIAAWQLAAFNDTWRRAVQRVPYYARLAAREGMPSTFSSWDEAAAIPPLTRGDLQRHLGSLYRPDSRPRGWRSTGGTTAEPIRIPVWRSEARLAAADLWLARGWFGIRPDDRLFLLWGHSHHFGRGLAGRLRRVNRYLLDRLFGYHRFSAYDLGEEAMLRAGDEILRTRPAYLLGYSAALDRLARVNRPRRDAFRKVGLKSVIATAEGFPVPGSEDLIHDMFGCPVAMEYGSVETGPVAHQDESGGFRVFWRHFRVELGPPAPSGAARPMRVTALYPRCLPLIRYEIDDLAVAEEAPAITRLERVVGRSNDFVLLADGTRIHSETFTHAIKDIRGVSAFQVIQGGSGEITIRYVSSERHGAPDLESVRQRLHRIHPDLGPRFEAVEVLDRTIAGKTKRVVRHPSWQPSAGSAGGEAAGEGRGA